MSVSSGAKALGKSALGVLLAVAVTSFNAQAAGYYPTDFPAVDSATMLDEGKCLANGAVADGDATLLKLDASCGAGPVELGLAAAYEQSLNSRSDIPSETGLEAKAKWAYAFDDEVGLGASYTMGFDAGKLPPEYVVSRVNGLFTWSPAWGVPHEYTVHLNLGDDFLSGSDAPGGDKSYVRWGAAFAWTPDPNILPDAMTNIGGWSFLIERFQEFDADFLRLGLRIAFSDYGSFELSREQGLSGNGEGARWIFGVTVPLQINF